MWLWSCGSDSVIAYCVTSDNIFRRPWGTRMSSEQRWRKRTTVTLFHGTGVLRLQAAGIVLARPCLPDRWLLGSESHVFLWISLSQTKTPPNLWKAPTIGYHKAALHLLLYLSDIHRSCSSIRFSALLSLHCFLVSLPPHRPMPPDPTHSSLEVIAITLCKKWFSHLLEAKSSGSSHNSSAPTPPHQLLPQIKTVLSIHLCKIFFKNIFFCFLAALWVRMR